MSTALYERAVTFTTVNSDIQCKELLMFDLLDS